MKQHKQKNPNTSSFFFSSTKKGLNPGEKDTRGMLYKRLAASQGGHSEEGRYATNHYIPVNEKVVSNSWKTTKSLPVPKLDNYQAAPKAETSKNSFTDNIKSFFGYGSDSERQTKIDAVKNKFRAGDLNNREAERLMKNQRPNPDLKSKQEPPITIVNGKIQDRVPKSEIKVDKPLPPPQKTNRIFPDVPPKKQFGDDTKMRLLSKGIKPPEENPNAQVNSNNNNTNKEVPKPVSSYPDVRKARSGVGTDTKFKLAAIQKKITDNPEPKPKLRPETT
jgi:hypothetical protein